jgi:sulfhydrogenase subunit gamma (sulfur reductase)
MNTMLRETLETTSIYLPVQAKILDVRPITTMDKLFTIELPDGLSLNHRAGQFVEVSIFGVGEAPISISSSPSRSNGSFELSIRKIGDLTGVLHNLQAGETLGIRGPFGHGFPLERFRGKDILFAPGGMGLAPLRSLINQVLDERGSFGRVIILYGARNPSEMLFTDELQDWEEREDVELHLTVDRADENWKGNVGVITTLFPKIQVYAPNTVGIVCGPPVMYRFVLMEMLGLGIRDGNIWMDLERRMKCGVGKCGHCQINHIYTCQDGPCFSYAQIKHLEEAL